jgi:hypothetical protein
VEWSSTFWVSPSPLPLLPVFFPFLLLLSLALGIPFYRHKEIV